jgi:hypothetical protein
MKKLLKIQYLLHLKLKNFQITFIKSYSLIVSNIQEHAQIPIVLNFELAMTKCST